MLFKPLRSVIEIPNTINDLKAVEILATLTHYNYPLNCFSNCSLYIPEFFRLVVNVTWIAGTDLIPFNAEYTFRVEETPNVDGRLSPTGSFFFFSFFPKRFFFFNKIFYRLSI